LDKAKYNELIKCIELNQIILYKLDCNVNDDVFEKPFNQAKVEFKPSFKLINKTENKIKVEANFSVKVTEENTNREIFNINSSFLLFYSISKRCEDEDSIKEFIDRNVRLNAWPFGREIINSMTARMGLPPLTIGLYKVY
jgi:preprotein translocase subunit SecB